LKGVIIMVNNHLINRINAIRKAGESYNNTNILKNRKAEIENYYNPFNALVQKYYETYETYTALKVIIPTMFIDLSVTKNNYDQMKKQIINDTYDRNLIATINRDLERIKNDLQKEWKGYISKRVSSIRGVIETLGNLISEMPEKQSMSRYENAFNISKIGSKPAVEAIDNYVDTYSVLMGKLNLSESVLNFLRQLTSSKTISLNDMNSEVYEWLKVSGFATKIKLSI